jgi:hypothetical protein
MPHATCNGQHATDSVPRANGNRRLSLPCAQALLCPTPHTIARGSTQHATGEPATCEVQHASGDCNEEHATRITLRRFWPRRCRPETRQQGHAGCIAPRGAAQCGACATRHAAAHVRHSRNNSSYGGQHAADDRQACGMRLHAHQRCKAQLRTIQDCNMQDVRCRKRQCTAVPKMRRDMPTCAACTGSCRAAHDLPGSVGSESPNRSNVSPSFKQNSTRQLVPTPRKNTPHVFLQKRLGAVHSAG